MKIIIAAFLILIGSPALAGEVLRIKESGTVITGDHKIFKTGEPVNIFIKGGIRDVTIKDVKFTGSIRTIGLGSNGEATRVQESSIRAGHTERAQAAAPTKVTIDNVEITADTRIPVYFGPGTTDATLKNSKIIGFSNGPATYLDAESANISIINNVYDVKIGKGREVIAIDGSEENLIQGNTIKNIKNGGIYVYRNCGEGGTIRHQTPQFNIIRDNTLDISKMNEWRNPTEFIFWWERPAGVWLGSREGIRAYCLSDSGHDFGSSKSNKDYANNNAVIKNNFIGDGWMIRDRGKDNKVRDNHRINK